MRICLGEYDLRFLLARGVGICGCQKLADLYYVQIAVAPIGINLELKEENNKKMRVQVQLPYNQDLQRLSKHLGFPEKEDTNQNGNYRLKMYILQFN